MCGAAGGDPAPFDEVDPSGTRLHADVAATAENRFHLTADGFDAHGTADGDGFAVNDADGVRAGVIGAGGRFCEEGGGKDRNGSGWKCRAAQDAKRVVDSRQERYSQAPGQKVSPILYVGCSSDA